MNSSVPCAEQCRTIASVAIAFCMAITMCSCESSTRVASNHEYFRLEDALRDPLDVRALNLYYAPCNGFSNEILNMKNLHTLIMPRCSIDSLPDGICDLPIEWLELQGNRLSKFPRQIFCMKKLYVLILSKNSIPRIPDSLDLLEEFVGFRMDSCGLASLPKSFVKFKCRNIWLNANEISVLPDSLSQMKGTLQYLNLKNNPISQRERDRILSELTPGVEVVF